MRGELSCHTLDTTDTGRDGRQKEQGEERHGGVKTLMTLKTDDESEWAGET